MRLHDLLSNLPQLLTRPDTNPEISAPISADSRTMAPGGVFLARRGLNVDSHRYISDAIAAGAVAVIGELPPDQVECSVPYARCQMQRKHWVIWLLHIMDILPNI